MLTPENICELRRAMGLSASEFGKRLGVAGNTVFRWESGDRHPKYNMQIELNKLLKDAERKGLLQLA